MTRKRFVKLLMAQGYDRNEAEEMALGSRERGMTYAESYKLITNFTSAFSKVMPNIGVMVEQAVEAIQRMAGALSEGISAFGNAFNAAMSKTE